MALDINGLKKLIFFEMLEMAGRVFVLVGHSPEVVVGARGFTPEEKERGLVLVFNSRMNFEWSEEGISAKLVFGTSSERCFIPSASIMAVFSPELSAQFSVTGATSEAGRGTAPPDESPPERLRSSGKEEKVVKVDFKKKK